MLLHCRDGRWSSVTPCGISQWKLKLEGSSDQERFLYSQSIMAVERDSLRQLVQASDHAKHPETAAPQTAVLHYQTICQSLRTLMYLAAQGKASLQALSEAGKGLCYLAHDKERMQEPSSKTLNAGGSL